MNGRSFEWLDKFDDDYQFIALNVKIDKNTQTVIGNEYFGAKMLYVDNICDLNQDGYKNFYAACMCSMEELFADKSDMMPSLQIYNTLAFPLLCREEDERFTNIENEFRIIAYDCPRIQNGVLRQIPRKAVLKGKSGIKYEGVLKAGENNFFECDARYLRSIRMPLKEVLGKSWGFGV